MFRLLPAAALAFALLAPAAHADVVATTAKPTPLAAAYGKVLYSAWDGSQYRLTELAAGALTSPAPTRPSSSTSDARAATRSPSTPVTASCTSTTSRPGASAGCGAGSAGSVSGDRLVFTRGNAIYERRGSAPAEAARPQAGAEPRLTRRALRLLRLAQVEP